MADGVNCARMVKHAGISVVQRLSKMKLKGVKHTWDQGHPKDTQMQRSPVSELGVVV